MNEIFSGNNNSKNIEQLEKLLENKIDRIPNLLMSYKTGTVIREKNKIIIKNANGEEEIITPKEHDLVFNAFKSIISHYIDVLNGKKSLKKIEGLDYNIDDVIQDLTSFVIQFIKNAPDKMDKNTVKEIFNKINEIPRFSISKSDDSKKTETLSGSAILTNIYAGANNEIDKLINIYDYINPVHLYLTVSDYVGLNDILIYPISYDDELVSKLGAQNNNIENRLKRIAIKAQNDILKKGITSQMSKEDISFTYLLGHLIVYNSNELLKRIKSGNEFEHDDPNFDLFDIEAHEKAILDRMSTIKIDKNLLRDLINGKVINLQEVDPESNTSGILKYSIDEINFIMEKMDSTKKTLMQALKSISSERAIELYISDETSKEVIKNLDIKSINLSRLLTDKKINANQLKEFIIKSSKDGKISYNKEQLDNLLNLKDSELSENIPEKTILYFDLIKNGIYPEEEIIDIYTKQSEYISNQETSIKGDYLQASDILDFFDGEKLIEKVLEDNDSKNRFLEFYSKLLIISPENTENIRSQIREKLTEMEKNPRSLALVVGLFKNNIISAEEAKIIINSENEFDLIDMKDDGLIEPETLLNLFEEGVISEEVTQLAYDDLEEISSKLKENKLSTKEIGQLISINALTIDMLKSLKDTNLLTDTDFIDIIQNTPSITVDEIGNMYIDGILHYDDLEILKNQGKLTINEYNDICRSKDYLKILKQLEEKKVILNLANERTGYSRTRKGGSSRKNNIIPAEIRESILGKIGCENTILIENGALKGYICNINKKLGCAILEKIYNSDGKVITQSNATYIVPLLKAVEIMDSSNNSPEQQTDANEIITKSNKFDLRNNSDCGYVYHTKLWGENLIKESVRVGNPYGLIDGDRYEFSTENEVKQQKQALTEELLDLCKEELDEIKLVKQRIK